MLMLKSIVETVETNFKVSLRAWFHLCVSIKPLHASIFVNGKNASQPYKLQNSNDLVNSGELMFGGKPRRETCFPVKIADARFYPVSLTEEKISSLMRGMEETRKNSIDLLKPQKSREPNGNVKYGKLPKKFLSQKTLNFSLLYVPETHVAKDSQKICQKFGGEVFDISNTTDDLKNYVKTVLLENSPTDIWSRLSENFTHCKVASVSSTEITISSENCSSMQTFLCKIPLAVSFKVCGFPPGTCKNVNFFSRSVYISNGL